MIGYLLFSHGSLLCGSGQALDEHTLRLSERLAPCPVEAGYLNYTEPDVEVAVERLVSRGATKIVVIPYFLVPGYFVTNSLPKRLAQIAPQYPSAQIVIAEALGVDSRIADAVIEAVKTARTPMLESADVLQSAGAACRLIEGCPLYGGIHCPRFVGGDPKPVSVTLESVPFELDSPKKTALLVMIHGSPDEKANQPMLDVLNDIMQRGIFNFVQPGFMECNAPTIPEAVDICASQGVDTIIAVPYFLHLGTHVADDLPTQLTQAQEKYTSIKILMTDYLGRFPQLTDVLHDRGLTLAKTL
jgi:sirohydrochlorin ferrochelatase